MDWKIKANNIKFDSRKILDDKSILYYSNTNESKNKITFLIRRVFYFPKKTIAYQAMYLKMMKSKI